MVLPIVAPVVFAQGGPPLRTDDPGTPGNGNWEINVACTQNFSPANTEIEAPLLDINYGLGDRIQLKFEIPYLLENDGGGEPFRRAFGDSLIGLKWRFYDANGWKISTYPQVEILEPTTTDDGQAMDRSAQVLLPFEITRQVGPVDINFEAGYWLVPGAPDQRILGLAVGRQFTKKFEGLAEIYDDVVLGGTSRSTTLDVGGRYELSNRFSLLFMVGRRILGSGLVNGQPSFIGYAGLQILLSPR
jgi:hypothetical protein